MRKSSFIRFFDLKRLGRLLSKRKPTKVSWGTEFVTLRDDMCPRPPYRQLDNSTIDRITPRCSELPPNGYNCRCEFLKEVSAGSPPPTRSELRERRARDRADQAMANILNGDEAAP